MDMSYEEALAWGAHEYRDVLDALAGAGMSCEFTQTGGMCAAIHIELNGGDYLLLTDLDDTLSWDRSSHRGWTVALYPAIEDESDGPVLVHSDPNGSAERAVELARRFIESEGFTL